jgi:serine/threonine protein kinase
MARDVASRFKDLRNSLYTDLVAYACIPRVEIDGVVTEQLERRFFPADTAKKVLTSNALDRLLTLVTPTGIRPAHLAQQVETRKLHVFLAVLIASNCDIEALASFTKTLLVPRTWTNALSELAKLPTEHVGNLRDVLGDIQSADLFFQIQHDFFAPIIEKNKEVRSQFRRVPYVREKLIGQGSFGRIYEVVVCLKYSSTIKSTEIGVTAWCLHIINTDLLFPQISPHHLKGDHSMSNPQEFRLARKDFELNAEGNAHENERDVLRKILRNAKQHSNIMESWGSLEIGSTYSLFMLLANCDLKQYMERYPSPPATPTQKADFVRCAVGLAGAIVFLHDELESHTYEKLSCFHMDLKPQNILVVIDPTSGDQKWKLSDFNMSRVKMKRRPMNWQPSLRRNMTFGENVYEINKLFKRRIPDAANVSVADYTINRRGTGTYLAPEACIEGHPVQAESDTWSLGCVISVAFSYLFGGQQAVNAYSELRGKKDIDRFFTFPRSSGPYRPKDAQVNEAVIKWHQDLRMKAKRRNMQEGAIFEKLINFLEDSVLQVDPIKRRETKASDVRTQLINAANEFEAFDNMNDPVSSPVLSTRSWLRSLSIAKVFQRRQSEIQPYPQDWKIQLSAAVKSCTFGPNAQPLVCITDSILTAYSLEHVLLSADSSVFDNDLMTYGQASPENKSRHWSPNVGVSSQYILARTNHHEFDVCIPFPVLLRYTNVFQCYFFHIAHPESHNGELELVAHWELRMPEIHALAMSPDGRYAAFVLFSDTPHRLNGSLYIIQLDCLQAGNSQRYMPQGYLMAFFYDHVPNITHSELSPIIPSSSGSSSNPSSLLGRALILPCPAEDVCELKISDMNGIYVVAKPRQSDSENEIAVHVYAWSLKDGRREALPQSTIKHDV